MTLPKDKKPWITEDMSIMTTSDLTTETLNTTERTEIHLIFSVFSVVPSDSVVPKAIPRSHQF
jgi:hypothetical protein